MPRPFRFAVQSFSALSGAAWRERARRVEALGYSALHLADHFLGPGPALAASNHPLQELAAVPAMAAAAAATETALFGTPDAICEELARRREAYGISYVTVGDNAIDAFAPVVARLGGK
jgi:alkanesulfonate monooxygenase SsuD/methylene tetrahydromethanopterin reductase-like flavin-dependent oxidoreductase (luciferase family)